MMLTLFENGMSFGSKIYGPLGTADFIYSVRYLMGIKLMPFSYADIGKNAKSLYYGINRPDLF